jgi:hypothetical protein
MLILDFVQFGHRPLGFILRGCDDQHWSEICLDYSSTLSLNNMISSDQNFVWTIQVPSQSTITKSNIY